MPRGVYDRKKVYKLKSTAQLVNEQINQAAQSTEVKQVSADLHNRLILDYQTLKTEHKQLIDGNNFIRRVLADRVNTIILLLEQLRGSL
jgi:hypothetical protein